MGCVWLELTSLPDCLSFPGLSLATLNVPPIAELSVTRCSVVKSMMCTSAAVWHVFIASVKYVYSSFVICQGYSLTLNYITLGDYWIGYEKEPTSSHNFQSQINSLVKCERAIFRKCFRIHFVRANDF